MMKKLLLTALLALTGVFALQPATSHAGLFDAAKQEACEGSQITSTTADCTGASTEADSLIQSIVDILSIIVGIIAVIMIIVSGLRFITSGGDANAVSSARNGVIYAIVGLILVAMAQLIVRFVLTRTG